MMPNGGESLRGMVFDIQRMSIHDGPGIRTTVFLKGCPLTCLWCHNPEGIAPYPQLAFTPSLCIGCGHCFECCTQGAHVAANGGHLLARERCVACFACVEGCYSGALETVGKAMNVSEVLDEVIKDKAFYEESGGGMTLSGGEPLAQLQFARGLLQGARSLGLHTCVETCGFADEQDMADIVPVVDLFLFDFKETDSERHRAATGQSNERIVRNLRLLDELGAIIVLRCPIVPGINLRDDHLAGIASVAQSLRIEPAVEVLGYHPLGESKRARFGTTGATYPPLSREETERVAARIREMGAEKVLVT